MSLTDWELGPLGPSEPVSFSGEINRKQRKLGSSKQGAELQEEKYDETVSKARRSSGNRYLSSSLATTFAAASVRLIGGCQRGDLVVSDGEDFQSDRCNPNSDELVCDVAGEEEGLACFFLSEQQWKFGSAAEKLIHQS
ncbi:hypothetical protein U1Q18_017441 [Sarracenia purpurea var. burkii]